MKLLIISCLLFASTLAQTDFLSNSEEFSNAVKSLEGILYPGYLWEVRDFQGNILASDSSGEVNSAGLKPHGDLNFRIWSMTKAIVATTAAKLVELGKLEWSATASKYIPSLAENGWKIRTGESSWKAAREPTIAELLSHTSGSYLGFLTVKEFLKRADSDAKSVLKDTGSWALYVQKAELECAPGTCWTYSRGHDVVGEVIATIEGMSLGACIRKYILEPLGMENTGFSIPKSRREGGVEIWTAQPIANMIFGAEDSGFQYHEIVKADYAKEHVVDDPDEQWFESPRQMGGGDLWSTLNDYNKFANMIANLGTSSDGVEILQTSTVKDLLFEIVHDLPVELGVGGSNFWEGKGLYHSKFSGFDRTNNIIHWTGIHGTAFFIDFRNKQIFTFFSSSTMIPFWIPLYDMYLNYSGGAIMNKENPYIPEGVIQSRQERFQMGLATTLTIILLILMMMILQENEREKAKRS